MQKQDTYTWHTMPVFTCVHTMATNMIRGIEMEIKQAKLIT